MRPVSQTPGAIYARNWRKKNPGRNAHYKRIHYWKDPARRHAKQLREAFGLTPEDFQRMLGSQEGLCAICRNPETTTYKGKVVRLAVDHNHTTGQIRGLLCRTCNNMLGHAQESTDILKGAIEYLEKWSCQ